MCKTADGLVMTNYSYVKYRVYNGQFYNVLQTPQELGLQVGDVIHIKDMMTLLPDRQKVVRDLLAEAPIKLTAKDVVEINISFHKAEEWKFNVRQQNSRRKEQTPLISLTVSILSYSTVGY